MTVRKREIDSSKTSEILHSSVRFFSSSFSAKRNQISLKHQAPSKCTFGHEIKCICMYICECMGSALTEPCDGIKTKNR